MCFSAEVSFLASGVLVVTGLFCVRKSRKVKNHFFMALTPFIFAIQQFLEGWVWIGINHDNYFLINSFSVAYLFFAFCFWLVWFPFVAYSTENVGWKKRLFIFLMIAGVIFGLYLWLPVLFGSGPRKLNATSICGNSLCYDLADGGYVPGLVREYIYALLGLLYLSSSDILFRKFWVTVMISALISIMIHVNAAASVWCFFSAMASIYIFFLIKAPIVSFNKNNLEFQS